MQALGESDPSNGGSASPNGGSSRGRKESGRTREPLAGRVISSRELVDNLREVVVHYSKYRHAGMVETEASVKAVQVGQQDWLFYQVYTVLYRFIWSFRSCWSKETVCWPPSSSRMWCSSTSK
jgi:hypothetical protein